MKWKKYNKTRRGMKMKFSYLDALEKVRQGHHMGEKEGKKKRTRSLDWPDRFDEE